MANGGTRHTVAILMLVIAVIGLTATALAKYYSLKGSIKDLDERWPRGGYKHLPIGSIVAYHGRVAPLDSSWLLCDGREIPGDYETLRGLVGPNTPDLRGMFLRGAGQNKDTKYTYAEGNTRTVGSPQQYATAQPKKEFKIANDGSHIHYLEGLICKSKEDGTWGHNQGGWRGFIDEKAKTVRDNENNGSHSHRILDGDEETRPSNYAVNFIIKASVK